MAGICHGHLRLMIIIPNKTAINGKLECMQIGVKEGLFFKRMIYVDKIYVMPLKGDSIYK